MEMEDFTLFSTILQKFYLLFGNISFILILSKDSKKFSDVSVRKIQKMIDSFRRKDIVSIREIFYNEDNHTVVSIFLSGDTLQVSLYAQKNMCDLRKHFTGIP